MSYRIHCLPAGEPQDTSYEIDIEGVEAKAHTARVSSMPFNRNWPGHQRPLNQTQTAPFFAFELDSPVTFRVVAQRNFSRGRGAPPGTRHYTNCKGS